MQSFFFYDLETSGLNPRSSRIMQFAGQRTDMDLQPMGEPINVLVRLTDDVLPDPGAIMVTGITPQSTLSDGLTEPEFCKLLCEEVCSDDTITVGFNSVRFDDEFIRHALWRNFYDPYEWCWSNGRSRWDLLDVVRLTRALRPDGIEWPVTDDGKAVNKLELITKANGLEHAKAHDALSDVEALIDVSRLIRDRQPKLFDYLLKMRDKKEIAKLVTLNDPQPFVYASGRYDAAYQKTTVVYPLAAGPRSNSILVYDLRVDPTPFLGATPAALASVLFASWEQRQEPDFQRVPVKELILNKCPAVSPMGVLDDATQQRLEIDLAAVQANRATLRRNPSFGEAIAKAFEQREAFKPSTDPEAQLYDGFIPDGDKRGLAAVRSATAATITDVPAFSDSRLNELLFRYKARWYPGTLSEAESLKWEQYRSEKLRGQLPKYLELLQANAKEGKDSYLIEELQLWAENVAPSDL